MIHALVISIDGAESNGLELLSQAARDAELAVTAVGPTWDTSGSSAALSAVSHSGQVWVQTPEHDDGGLYALDATPAFIVRSSFYGTFGAQPDVVLAGVHEGRNTGQATLHSGTVGAALTGTARGCPSLAISADAGASEETVAHVAHLAVNWLLQLRQPCVLNVNIPDCSLEELRGIRKTTLGIREAGSGRR